MDDFKNIFPFVMFIVIGLFAVIKAVLQKNAEQQRQQGGGKPGQWEAPTDDVRKFLQQVAGVPQKQPRQAHAKAKPAKKATPKRSTLEASPTVEHSSAKSKPAFHFNPKTLRSEKNLRTAIVIREIIDKPLALRPRGR